MSQMITGNAGTGAQLRSATSADYPAVERLLIASGFRSMECAKRCLPLSSPKPAATSSASRGSRCAATTRCSAPSRSPIVALARCRARAGHARDIRGRSARHSRAVSVDDDRRGILPELWIPSGVARSGARGCARYGGVSECMPGVGGRDVSRSRHVNPAGRDCFLNGSIAVRG